MIKPKKLKIYEESFDNVVVEVDDQYIVRFPQLIQNHYDIERLILRKLVKQFGAFIPNIVSEGRIHQFMVYRKIQGEPLRPSLLRVLNPNQRTAIAYSLAKFMQQLHGTISANEAIKLGVPPHDLMRSKKLIVRRAQNAARGLRVFRSEILRRFVIKQTILFARLALVNQHQVLLHGDIHCGNVIVAPSSGHVNGIIDFGNISIGDDRLELVPLYKCNVGLWNTTITEYEKLSRRTIDRSTVQVLAYMNEILDAVVQQPVNARLYHAAVGRLYRWANASPTR